MTVPKTKKNTKLYFSPEVMSFLDTITKPAILTHEASHADMIRNTVLEDIRRRIDHADQS